MSGRQNNLPGVKYVPFAFLPIILTIIVTGHFQATLIISFIILEVICFFAFPLIITAFCNFDVRKVFKIRKISLYQLVLVVIISFTFINLLAVFNETILIPILTNINYNARDDIQKIENFVNSFMMYGEVVRLLLLIILPPICEEVFFRGFILTCFSKNLGKILGIIITATLFGAIHGNILQAISAFPLGIILGVAVSLSRSIFPAVIMHFINNATACALGYNLLPQHISPLTTVTYFLIFVICLKLSCLDFRKG